MRTSPLVPALVLPVVLLLVLAGPLPAEEPAEAGGDAASRFFGAYDADGDGRLSRAEFPAWLGFAFPEIDRDKDGFVTKAEDAAYRKRAQRRSRRRPTLPAPAHADVRYGPHARNIYDVWRVPPQIETDSGLPYKLPTPLVVYYHGGGFRGGDKRTLNPALLQGLLEEGIAVAAANYRLSKAAPFPAQMHDAALALQHLRAHAAEYGIDPKRVGATGGSAGGGISLWLAFHDDLAAPDADDPALRQSTRIRAAVVYAGQSTYDPRAIQELFGTTHVDGALIPFFGMSGPEDVKDERFHPLFVEASPITHASADDPPVYLFYPQPNQPLPQNSRGGQHIHHPKLGILLKKRLDDLGVECVLRLREDVPRGTPVEEYVRFFVEKLKRTTLSVR